MHLRSLASSQASTTSRLHPLSHIHFMIPGESYSDSRLPTPTCLPWRPLLNFFLLWSWVLIFGLFQLPSSSVRPRMLCSFPISKISGTTRTLWHQRLWSVTANAIRTTTVVSGFHHSTTSSPIGRAIKHQPSVAGQSEAPHSDRVGKPQLNRLFFSKESKSASFSVPAMGTADSGNSNNSASNGNDSTETIGGDGRAYTGYEKWVRRLYATNMFHPVKLGLTNMRRLHKLLGDPMDDVRTLYVICKGGALMLCSCV